MARRIKSLTHGNLPTANPYETPKQLSKSPYHREHRSKRGRIKHKPESRYGNALSYKAKKQELKLKAQED